MADYLLETQAHEWLLSSQSGAYALGTGNLINQRKYNGLLTKSDKYFNRILLVSSIEEQIEWRGESFFCDSSHYNNCIFPEGFLHLVKSWLRPFPVFLYSSLPHNDDILIKKEILMDEQSSTVLVKYTNLGSHKLHFILRPKYAIRNHHYLNEPGTWSRVRVYSEFETDTEQGSTKFMVQRLDSMINVFGWLHRGNGFEDFRIYGQVYYPWEANRGYPCSEELVSPLGFDFDLAVNESNYLIFSDERIETSVELISRIEKRYSKLPIPFDLLQKRKKYHPTGEESILMFLDNEDHVFFNGDDYEKILEFSMQDFLANNDVVAGFPWFGAWGRDTMISLEGILHLPKGTDIAFRILEKYAGQIKNGLIPNMCSESHQTANYISIDSTLWFVIRSYQVGLKLVQMKSAKRNKLEKWKHILLVTEQILEDLLVKPHEDFGIRPDGLFELKAHFSSATWMDAKVGDKAVTPRDGSPVEINALLYNALSAYEKMIEEHNDLCTGKNQKMVNNYYLEIKSKICLSFQKYWFGNYLADRLVGNELIQEIRPNAIIAASLPFSRNLLSVEQMQQLYETAHLELYTPYGLRSLSPKDSKFQKKFIGKTEERDKAYHNGTVWAWLLLPLAHTWLSAYPDKTSHEKIQQLSSFIEKLRNGYQRGHIASVAEVWDGDKPHFPKGCPAQAWSVSAIYTIEKLIKEEKGQSK